VIHEWSVDQGLVGSFVDLGLIVCLGLRVRVVLAFILLTRYRYFSRGEL
jgi:hypothetical protein